MDSNVTVISLGGSMIIPDTLNATFVKEFVAAINERVAAGRRFVIVAGGGKTARVYQAGLREIGIEDSKTLDWIGIYATHLNAEVLRFAFGDAAHDAVIKDPEAKVNWTTPILIAGGGIPGWSTDYDAILLAQMYGAKSAVNVSNIDYVYTADPKKDPTATKIEKITWDKLIEILPEKWSPGLSSPFDPIAARKASELGISVSIVNGGNLDNVFNAIDGAAFQGTSITP